MSPKPKKLKCGLSGQQLAAEVERVIILGHGGFLSPVGAMVVIIGGFLNKLVA